MSRHNLWQRELHWLAPVKTVRFFENNAHCALSFVARFKWHAKQIHPINCGRDIYVNAHSRQNGSYKIFIEKVNIFFVSSVTFMKSNSLRTHTQHCKHLNGKYCQVEWRLWKQEHRKWHVNFMRSKWALNVWHSKLQNRAFTSCDRFVIVCRNCKWKIRANKMNWKTSKAIELKSCDFSKNHWCWNVYSRETLNARWHWSILF